jgi:hypothetical protein
MTIQIDDFTVPRTATAGGWCGTRRPGTALCGTSPTCPLAVALPRPLWRIGWIAQVPARRTRRCGHCWKDQTPQGGLNEMARGV